ncbi:MAG TPA: hypothetical protein VFY67_00020 [Pyrinomonadaceae bacterium]|nr:hypothetical protein [Pyrinomonadaceae bacterium]
MNDLKSLGHVPHLARVVDAWSDFSVQHAHDWWQKADLPSNAFWGGEVAAKLLTRYRDRKQ